MNDSSGWRKIRKINGFNIVWRVKGWTARP